MQAVVILGCEGRQDDGFKFCNGVNNVLLDLEKISNSDNYDQIMDYLDKVVGVFKNPCCKPNIISNAIYKMYELSFFNDIEYKYISHFYRMHDRCGLVLTAVLK